MTDKQVEDDVEVPKGPVEVAQFGAKQALTADFLSGKAGFDYLRFVLNPDIERPIRMPSGYTYPTVLVSWKDNITFTAGNTSSGSFCGYFAPQNSLSNSPMTDPCRDYFLATRNGSTYAYNTQNWKYMSDLELTKYLIARGNGRFPYYTRFNGARVIGAVMEIVYVGALQDTSGTYIVSANILGLNARPQGYSSGALDAPGAPGVNSPPTVNQQFNERIVKKYMGGDVVRMTWFPVDYSCAKFQAVGYDWDLGSQASFSQLVFYINAYGFPNNAQFDVRVQIFYEATPNLAYTDQFVGMQAAGCDDWKEQWNKITTIAREDLGRVLLTGARGIK